MKSRKIRRGAAVAEFAVCIPVIFLIIFGSIEACNLFHLRQALVGAAYEGALDGSSPGATEAEIVLRAQTSLGARNITPGNVSVIVSGGSFDTANPGSQFTVHVDAPVNLNNAGVTMFAAGTSIHADVVGQKH